VHQVRQGQPNDGPVGELPKSRNSGHCQQVIKFISPLHTSGYKLIYYTRNNFYIYGSKNELITVKQMHQIYFMAWWSGLVVWSPSATKEIEAKSRDIESRQGIEL
jgi:hypothetical protein